MKVPNFLQNQRKHSGQEVVTSIKIDPYIIVTDASRVHVVDLYGAKIEYIPLTVAEELSIPEDASPLFPVYWMISKAMKKRIEQGIITDSDWQVLDVESFCETHISYLYLVQLQWKIYQQRELFGRMIVDLYEACHEESMDSSGGRPRVANNLDEHISMIYLLEKSPFSSEDVHNMTKVQIMYYNMVINESLIRANNDSIFRMKKTK